MSNNDSTNRLLLAEMQFSELAEQLQKLKNLAQEIEKSERATGQMRELAKSAIKTAKDLGDKIHETADIIKNQNIDTHLKESEIRQYQKTQDALNLSSKKVLQSNAENHQELLAVSQKTGELIQSNSTATINKLNSIIDKMSTNHLAILQEQRKNSRVLFIMITLNLCLAASLIWLILTQQH